MYVRVDIRVRFDTPFNIGSGAAEGTWADRPLLKDHQGLPMIPASSFKGRLRHACERLCNALYKKGLLDQPPCRSPNAETMCQQNEVEGLCPICRLFGSPWIRSPLNFQDLLLIEPAFLREAGVLPRTTLRYGVSISRYWRVAERHHLFTTEVFQPGGELVLAGTIEGEATRKDLALLLAGLDFLRNLGGGKTCGMGWCQIEVIVSDADGRPVDTEKIRRRWIDGIE